MKLYFNYLIVKHIYIAYFSIFFISFLESLAFLGFFVPSSMMMFMIGFFIGKGNINFYYSYILVILGCTLGDIISYYVGNYFRDYLFFFRREISKYVNIFEYMFKYFKKNSSFLIISGKFTGPIKSFFFFVSGMLNISIKKIILPNFFSTLLWSISFFIPGILSGVAVTLPNSFYFKTHLFSFIFLFIISIYIFINILNRNYINKKLSILFLFFFCFLCIKHLLILVNNNTFFIFTKLILKLFF